MEKPIDVRSEERLRRLLEKAVRRSTSASNSQLTPLGSKGIILTVDVVTAGAGGNITPVLLYREPDDGFHVIYEAPVSITAAGKYIYMISPDAVLWGDMTDIFISPIPTVTRFRMRHAGAADWEYSAWAEYI